MSQPPLRWIERLDPRPGPGEVLVKVRACGVCRTDLHVVEGELPVRRPDIIPGHQVVGEVAARGEGVSTPALGDRVGVAWLHHTCGRCRFCLSRRRPSCLAGGKIEADPVAAEGSRPSGGVGGATGAPSPLAGLGWGAPGKDRLCLSGRENLCERADFTGWTVDGGYATHLLAAAAFVYPIPVQLSDAQAAPLLCAGIIGYRCLRLSGITEWRGARLGIYGFGAAGHIAIQIARAHGAEVYVCTRDHENHQRLARELGAAWVGDAAAPPPVPLDAALMFAPAGELVPPALRALDRGGTLVLGGIHMSTIPELDYDWLYGERVIRSVANNTRADGREFLAEAHAAGVHTHVRQFPMSEANAALLALKQDAIAGAAVLVV